MTTSTARKPRRRARQSCCCASEKIPPGDPALRRDAEQLAAQTIGKNVPIHSVRVSDDPALSALVSRRDHALCRAICQTETGRKRCAASYRTNLDLARRQTEPRVFVCHAGLTNVALPIGDSANGEGLVVGRVFINPLSAADKKKLADDLCKSCGVTDAARLLAQAAVVSEDDLLLAALIARNLAAVRSQSLPRLRRKRQQPIAPRRRHLLRHQRICQEVADIIERDFAQPLCVAKIAASVNLTPNYLCSVFHKTTRITLSEHIARVRVQKSQSLLAQPQLRIKQVAYQVGFTDPNHFAVVFKRVTGLTPSEWRARQDEAMLGAVRQR